MGEAHVLVTVAGRECAAFSLDKFGFYQLLLACPTVKEGSYGHC